ncbi:hypothetical protein FJZ23_03300 [Candidatus Parcubacteria bacterium]|nr:hypothetical protein [Candidatus Parcubacteria bacterium]
MLQKEYRTKDGSVVVPYNNAAEYLKGKEQVIKLLPEAIGMMDLSAAPARLEKTLDMGREISPATLIETGSIIAHTRTAFIRRPDRRGPSRVVLFASADSLPKVSTLVVMARRMNDGRYRLLTAYSGIQTPQEPWETDPDTDERDCSLTFWCEHALIHIPNRDVEVRWSTWAEELRTCDSTLQSS